MTSLVAKMVTEAFHRDDEGRPLREGRTPDEFFKPGEIDFKTCPYAGGRFQHALQMNASALRQTSAHWDEICNALAVVRSGYAAVRPYKPDVMDLWRVSQLGSSLPWFFLFKQGSIPAYAAALAKATQGVGMWTQNMLVRMLTQQWQPPVFDPATMVADVEASGTLIGAHEVCAGPEKMIERFFEVYLGGEGTGELAGMRDELVNFGAHYANFKLVVWIFYLARRYLLHEVGTPEAKNLLQHWQCEPADFFVLEAPDPANVPRPMRAVWLKPLADLVVSFAPDKSDAPHVASALQLALASGLPGTPAETFHRLETIFAAAVARVETAFGGTSPPTTDSIIAAGTRAALAT